MPRGEAAKDWRMSRCVSAMHSIIFTKTQFISLKKKLRRWIHEMMISWDVHSLQNKDKGSNLFCSTPPGLASLVSLHATVTAAKVGRTKVLWKGLFGKDDWLRFKLPFPSNLDVTWSSKWRNDVDVFLSVLLYHGVYLSSKLRVEKIWTSSHTFPKENVA